MDAQHLLATQEENTPQRLLRKQTSYDVWSEKRDQLLLKERTYQQQYSNFYFQRLVQLKPHVTAEAKHRWSHLSDQWELLSRILDIKPDQLCCIIGTVYIEMKHKPNVLDDVIHEHKVLTTTSNEPFYADDDVISLEDESGRISVSGQLTHTLVSGVVMGVLGRQNSQGEFIVEDICFSSLPPPLHMPSVVEETQYLALVSGVRMGAEQADMLRTQLLVQYLRGELGSLLDQEEEEANIVRVVFAGNTFLPLTLEADLRHARRSGPHDQEHVTHLQQADMFLSCIAQSVEVDLMPGALDPALQIMPQQPIASVLLPQASHCTLFHPVTNPYWAKIGNRVVLGQAGQSLDDIMRYVDTSDRLAMAEQTLYWRHIAPTAPDTLWSYPFQDREPFLIDACPNIYFIGNQPKFETKLVQGDEGQKVRLILLPDFATTGTLVLVNLATLECYPVTLQV